MLAAVALPSSGCLTVHVFDGRTQPFVETTVYGETGPKILMLDIDGVIRDDPGPRPVIGARHESTTARVREQLDRAREDPEVCALLLRIDSPGGTATASDIVYREILRFKRERGVPVVAQLMGTAASGGYYVAMAADEVVAHPTTVTGSIGVLFVGINVVGLMEKIGVENQTLVAGKYKDGGSILRRMTPAERHQIQSILDDLHARFKAVVANGRSELDQSQVDALADGRIYSAQQAVENGLVDRIGDLESTVAVVKRRAGIETARVVTYHRSREWRQNLYTEAPAVPSSLRLELWPEPLLAGPAFLYLWAPGSLVN